jgi:hypothetical protein
MLHIILVNAGLEQTQQRFLPMLDATTRQSLQGKDVCSLNLESQPTAQYIQGNNTETKPSADSHLHLYTYELFFLGDEYKRAITRKDNSYVSSHLLSVTMSQQFNLASTFGTLL